ncbi:MAG TPA: HD domain-containing protein [Candidatus Sphingobacterium stercoripullorum]|nr:HD domain-containing protein [Candidatus Sphingobacterium stercoripullorum]
MQDRDSLILEKTIDYVKQELHGIESGHDWFHIQRVLTNTNMLLEFEEGDPLVCQLAALLHDIADSKFHSGNEEIGPLKAKAFLESMNINAESIEHVTSIIRNMSFSSSFSMPTFDSPEYRIVQDADRLDAIGAIGIARAFNYGGYKNREIYNPEIQVQEINTSEDYKSNADPTINHFHVKLLKLKDKMNTKTARSIAEKRHAFMQAFLDQFYQEWSGKA